MNKYTICILLFFLFFTAKGEDITFNFDKTSICEGDAFDLDNFLQNNVIVSVEYEIKGWNGGISGKVFPTEDTEYVLEYVNKNAPSKILQKSFFLDVRKKPSLVFSSMMSEPLCPNASLVVPEYDAIDCDRIIWKNLSTNEDYLNVQPGFIFDIPKSDATSYTFSVTATNDVCPQSDALFYTFAVVNSSEGISVNVNSLAGDIEYCNEVIDVSEAVDFSETSIIFNEDTVKISDTQLSDKYEVVSSTLHWSKEDDFTNGTNKLISGDYSNSYFYEISLRVVDCDTVFKFKTPERNIFFKYTCVPEIVYECDDFGTGTFTVNSYSNIVSLSLTSEYSDSLYNLSDSQFEKVTPDSGFADARQGKINWEDLFTVESNAAIKIRIDYQTSTGKIQSYTTAMNVDVCPKILPQVFYYCNSETGKGTFIISSLEPILDVTYENLSHPSVQINKVINPEDSLLPSNYSYYDAVSFDWNDPTLPSEYATQDYKITIKYKDLFFDKEVLYEVYAQAEKCSDYSVHSSATCLEEKSTVCELTVGMEYPIDDIQVKNLTLPGVCIPESWRDDSITTPGMYLKKANIYWDNKELIEKYSQYRFMLYEITTQSHLPSGEVIKSVFVVGAELCYIEFPILFEQCKKNVNQKTVSAKNGSFSIVDMNFENLTLPGEGIPEMQTVSSGTICWNKTYPDTMEYNVTMSLLNKEKDTILFSVQKELSQCSMKDDEFTIDCSERTGVSTLKYASMYTIDSIVIENISFPGLYIPELSDFFDSEEKSGANYLHTRTYFLNWENIMVDSMNFKMFVYETDCSGIQYIEEKNFTLTKCLRIPRLYYGASKNQNLQIVLDSVCNKTQCQNTEGSDPVTESISIICLGEQAFFQFATSGFLVDSIDSYQLIVDQNLELNIISPTDYQQISNSSGKLAYSFSHLDDMRTTVEVLNPKSGYFTGTYAGIPFSFYIDVKEAAIRTDTSICYGTTFDLNDMIIESNSKLHWNVSETIIKPFYDSKYYVYGITQQGCQMNYEVQVNVDYPLWHSVENADACIGYETDLNEHINTNARRLLWFDENDVLINNPIVMVTKSEKYKIELVSACDNKTVSMDLLATDTVHRFLYDTICIYNSYQGKGFDLPVSNSFGDFEYKRVAPAGTIGCDTIYFLRLNVLTADTTVIDAEICANKKYELNGFSENSEGMHTLLLQNKNGCDSLVVLNLQVHPVYDIILYDTTCQNMDYSDYDFTWQANESSGGYSYRRDTISMYGCDSAVTLNLWVNPIYNEVLIDTVCPETDYEDYHFSGNAGTISGDFTWTQNLLSEKGCDSTVVLNLNVRPYEYATDTLYLCEGLSVGFYTETYTAPGTYKLYIPDDEHCVVHTVNVLSVKNPVINGIKSLGEGVFIVSHETIDESQPYLFDIDDGTLSFDTERMYDVNFGIHTLTLYDRYKCQDTMSFSGDIINVIPDDYFTPNGDGENDRWTIKHIEIYPDAKVCIYDRHGKLLMGTKSYDNNNGWDGTYYGKELPSTDYWYEISLPYIDRLIVGHFTLKRK